MTGPAKARKAGAKIYPAPCPVSISQKNQNADAGVGQTLNHNEQRFAPMVAKLKAAPNSSFHLSLGATSILSFFQLISRMISRFAGISSKQDLQSPHDQVGRVSLID